MVCDKSWLSGLNPLRDDDRSSLDNYMDYLNVQKQSSDSDDSDDDFSMDDDDFGGDDF